MNPGNLGRGNKNRTPGQAEREKGDKWQHVAPFYVPHHFGTPSIGFCFAAKDIDLIYTLLKIKRYMPASIFIFNPEYT